MTHAIRMTKSNIRCVISSEARAANRHAMASAFAPREIEHVAYDHIFVRVVGTHSVCRMNRFVIKTLQIDRVGAVNRHFAVVYEPRDRADQPEILVFVITSTRSGEKNQRQTALISKNKHLKLA